MISWYPCAWFVAPSFLCQDPDHSLSSWVCVSPPSILKLFLGPTKRSELQVCVELWPAEGSWWLLGPESGSGLGCSLSQQKRSRGSSGVLCKGSLGQLLESIVRVGKCRSSQRPEVKGHGPWTMRMWLHLSLDFMISLPSAEALGLLRTGVKGSGLCP